MNYINIQFIEFLAGTDIEDAIKKSIDLAYLNSSIVKFTFNGVEMRICEYSILKDRLSYYHEWLKED